MEMYEELIEKAYKEVKAIAGSGERFEIPKASGQVSGKNTIITNLSSIASYLRRPVEHLAKFLLKELASPGRIDGERLIIQTKLHSSKVNDKIVEYAQVFVLCPECQKPDTEIVSEKGLKFKHCLACGAKSPVKG